MISAATSTLSTSDLITLYQGIAQINLGYLGISVGILGVLGGVFIYFNIKPLKDSLDKQEKKIDELRKEARELLAQSKEQSDKALEDFKVNQTELMSKTLKHSEETLLLETENKLREVENLLSDKIETISENKDVKLKDSVLAEVTNIIGKSEKKLTADFVSSRAETAKEVAEANTKLAGLSANLKDMQRDIKELKVFKFSNRKQMGAIIYSIDLLREDIGENSWRILGSLETLLEEIKDVKLDPGYVAQIEEQLGRIQSNPKYSVIIGQIRACYSDQTK